MVSNGGTSADEDVTTVNELPQPEATPRRRRLVTAGRLGILFGLTPYLFFFLILPIVTPIRHELLNSSGTKLAFFGFMQSLGLLMLLGACFAFRAVSRNTQSQPQANRRERILGWIGLGLFLVNMIQPWNASLLAGFVRTISEPEAMLSKAFNMDKQAQSSNERDLTGLYYSLNDFAEKQADKCFPKLSSQPGRLMHDAEELPNNQMPSNYVARNDPMYHQINDAEFHRTYDSYVVDDWSYFYLGYVIQSDSQMQAFAEIYKQRVAAHQGFETDLPSPAFPDNTMQRLNKRPPVISADAKRPPLPTVEGEDVPVMIERIEHNKNKGGSVLFLDGHVEYIEYPGRWPMTEITIALLHELDRLGPQGGAQQ